MIVHGLGSMATQTLLPALAEHARAAGLSGVRWEATGGVTAAQRVEAGDAVDLVALALPSLQALARGNLVIPDTVTPLVSSAMAAAVPAGTPAPTWADSGGVRDVLERASAIGYSTGPSGRRLRNWIAEWGLSDQVGDRLVEAQPGVPVARLIAEGHVSLGFQQLSELDGQPGITVVPLPADCADRTVFGAAVLRASVLADEARAELAHYASAATAGLRREHGFELPEEHA